MRSASVFVKQEVLFLTENMLRKSQNLKYMLSLVPGKKRFGVYRFLPVFFCIGGVMEWIMINVRIGRETFYDVYRRKQSERAYQQKTEEGLIMLTDSQAKWQHHNISMKRLKPVHWTLEYVGHQLEGSCDMGLQTRTQMRCKRLSQCVSEDGGDLCVVYVRNMFIIKLILAALWLWIKMKVICTIWFCKIVT